MKKIIQIIIFSLIFSFSQVIYANDSWVFDDGKTIKNLKKELENIDKNTDILDSNIQNFFDDNKIDSFLKKTISEQENFQLKKIVSLYLSKNKKIENEIKKSKTEKEIEKNQINLLDLKKDLYKWLIPFIDKEKYKNYLNYIENETNNIIETNNLYLAKFSTQSNYNKKVDILERKIQENKENLDLELKLLVEKKIDEKILDFLKSPNFLKLTKENKIKILNKIVFNLKTQKKFIEIKDISDFDKQKLDIYNIFIWKISDISYKL